MAGVGCDIVDGFVNFFVIDVSLREGGGMNFGDDERRFGFAGGR